MAVIEAQDARFRVGTREFHREPNMNYQFNRIMSVCGGDPDEIEAASRSIETIEDWIEAFTRLARAAEASGRTRHAAAYWRAVNFYLAPSDPRKRETYDAFVTLSRERYREPLESGRLRESRVPFAGGELPVWHMAARNPGRDRSSVLFHLGYDSCKEELYPVMEAFSDAGLDIWLFEGPGQGEALYRSNLVMTHEWERPVSAILDALGLEDVTLVGLSLGGYLAPRAAWRDKRIARVVAWGVLYDFYDVVVSRRGKGLEAFLRTCRALHAKWLLNAVVSGAMRRDTYTRWGVEQGMFVFGVKSPWDYFETLGRYSLKGISREIWQDFLLIGSTRDHFIPEGDFARQVASLTGVRSLTARLFTEAENAENHVQFGNLPLVCECMIDWIKERAGR